jgi:hypothetical protein
MVLLSAPFDPCPTRRVVPLCRSRVLAVTGALALTGAGLVIQRVGGALSDVGQGAANAAVHGGFLAAGWLITVPPPAWPGPVIHSAGALLLASVTSRFSAWGALLYLLPPVLLLREGVRHPALRGIGLGSTGGLRHLALGLAAGTFLGGHLLLSASLTLGYAVRVGSPSRYLAAVAYDIGANALSAEWLFRGALFSRWWRRWEFWPAGGMSTALAVGRYLVDPALPPTVEVRAGAVFYTALLGVSACELRAWSGSLLPGYFASVVFFAAYRMLVQ